ncbi:MAG: prolipoprotein diacylglyceryl transferase [Candidatus Latescibacteria bacterium]|nr:prolipoprotein diacylglyceryl transferase [Candidatus Latescibacterota bacterium]NIO27282.1 prolipoprotein diacylglyceryl transferase [Candidatus Latescibacterota bacterium]NIO54806.1 prolipoprotein diacylglyceryl transferase [Candidatus Latescibacterota bacterium]NIT00889.1 prolipoprotein diacylglyceryl transferase [Candidatus Latescibacterota bacterium]NIT37812.1 prolipoprotein diacylglyceryl transferase [Candidatus Latescibacterota bacterium]
MHPVLIQVGWFTIHSYGFMLALSFLVGILVASKRARNFGLEPQHILDISVYIILTAVVGSRLLYVAFHLDEYRNFLDMFALWEGGATLYGGLLLAILASYIYTSRKRLSFLFTADALSPSIALGLAFTRIGCFMSGCCFGKVTDLPWGVTFPTDCAAGYYSLRIARELSVPAVKLHPTQLYASLYGLITFLLLFLFERRVRKKGGTFGALLVMYGVFRFSLDFFRIYEEDMLVLFGLTLNQVISVGMFLIGIYLLLRKTSERRSAPSGNAG